jgi:hypothetical protein
MNTHDLLNEVIKLKRQSINDEIVQYTAIQIIEFYQVTDLGQLIDSLEQLYTESKLQSMANDMANYYGFELLVDTYETRIIAITKAFKLLQKLVNQAKYQSYYKQWLTTH